MTKAKVPRPVGPEHCRECDEPTGQADAGEDSLCLTDGYGPLCPTCYHVFNNWLELGRQALRSENA